MIKKTVSYNNLFTGEPITKDLYFHMDAAELAEMTVIEGEGWADRIQSLQQDPKGRGKEIIEQFKQLLGAAYGEREGDDLVKSDEITAKFLRSQAYNKLFMELITSKDSGGSFFAALVPADLEQYAEQLANNPELTKASAASDPTDKRPAWIRENREPTASELQRMSKAELAEAFKAQLSSKQPANQ